MLPSVGSRLRELSDKAVRSASRQLSRLLERGARALRVIGQPAELEGAAPVEYSEDVRDVGRLQRELSETDLFGEAVEEAAAYLAASLERFRITMSLVPRLAPGERVLELGASPYFLTRLLLKRDLDVTGANWFGPEAGFGSEGEQKVVESGVPHTYQFDHFNIESERFPYEDGTFAVVLFCEILEHLPVDPIHALAEIHRVLRLGGTLILTTPNAVRLDNLYRVMDGSNMYETLSGYGVYGRHNREYTVGELNELLGSSNFVVDRIFSADIGNTPPPRSLDPAISRADRGENLFVVAHTQGSPRWPYPSWLYSSTHALSRIVLPDLLMGTNCELQASGFYELETIEGRPARWTGRSPSARALVTAPAGPAELRVEGFAPPRPAGRSISLTARLGSSEASWPIVCDGAAFCLTATVDAPGGPAEVVLETDRVWRPVDVGINADGRTLGVLISGVALTPVRARSEITPA
jgi:SAM-dependent methyltransferase